MVAVMKDYNLIRHCDTKHASKYNNFGHFQSDKLQLKSQLSCQQSTFVKGNHTNRKQH